MVEPGGPIAAEPVHRGFRQFPPAFGARQQAAGVLVPNRLLDPVTALSFELGGKIRRPDWWLDVSIYRTEIGNNITQQFLAIGGRQDFVSLAGGLPASELYPIEPMREAMDRALTRWRSDALEYGPVEGFPACDFELYLQVGSLVGLVTLPAVILWRLWQSDAARRTSQRGTIGGTH